jgi:hypothetical protein
LSAARRLLLMPRMRTTRLFLIGHLCLIAVAVFGLI